MPSSARPRRLVVAGLLAVAALTACGGDSGTPTVSDGSDTSGTSDDVRSATQRDGVGETNWRANDLPGMGAVIGGQRATYEYVIPPGAGDALAAGEPLRIVPGRFEAKVGESVRIVNEDRQGHNVGPWYVGPNETLFQKFTSPGVYEGLCTVHPSGAMILEVSA